MVVSEDEDGWYLRRWTPDGEVDPTFPSRRIGWATNASAFANAVQNRLDLLAVYSLSSR